MFHMENTGKKISAARKAKNLTQMELADSLNISFQAVSNWERGISMPDISKLPELSELLGISIDDLLGKQSKLVSGLIAEDTDAFLQSNEVDMDELLEAAPILKPEQVDKIFYFRHENPDRDTLLGLLPFLGQEACDVLFEKYCAEGDMDEVVSFAPFVSSEKIGEMALRGAKRGDEVAGLLPFMERADIEAVTMACYKARGADAVHAHIPFAGSALLFQIALAECEAGEDIAAFAPFLSSEHLAALAKKAAETGNGNLVTRLAPFLGKDLLWKLVKGELQL